MSLGRAVASTVAAAGARVSQLSSAGELRFRGAGAQSSAVLDDDIAASGRGNGDHEAGANGDHEAGDTGGRWGSEDSADDGDGGDDMGRHTRNGGPTMRSIRARRMCPLPGLQLGGGRTCASDIEALGLGAHRHGFFATQRAAFSLR